jgi:hypothetical protein
MRLALLCSLVFVGCATHAPELPIAFRVVDSNGTVLANVENHGQEWVSCVYGSDGKIKCPESAAQTTTAPLANCLAPAFSIGESVSDHEDSEVKALIAKIEPHFTCEGAGRPTSVGNGGWVLHGSECFTIAGLPWRLCVAHHPDWPQEDCMRSAYLGDSICQDVGGKTLCHKPAREAKN